MAPLCSDDPQTIHQIGLEEVNRIKNMKTVISEHKALLMIDLSNFVTTSEDMLNGYRNIIRDVHDKLSTILNKVPAAAISVKKLENQGGPRGRYSEPPLDGSKSGIFWANAHNPVS